LLTLTLWTLQQVLSASTMQLVGYGSPMQYTCNVMPFTAHDTVKTSNGGQKKTKILQLATALPRLSVVSTESPCIPPPGITVCTGA